jgi:hypothetical protein
MAIESESKLSVNKAVYYPSKVIIVFQHKNMDIAAITGRMTAFFETEHGKKILTWARRVVNIAIAGWLIYQLTSIGWEEFWRSLPAAPLFYVLFGILFLQLPLFEIFIYRLLWVFNVFKSIPVFILKRVYNKDVIDYSGEVYFFGWAKETLALSGTEIFKTIKDNNIISSVASTLISIGLLAGFFFTGQIKIIQNIASQNRTYFLAGVILLVILAAFFIKFRHTVISMPLKTAYKIFGIQISRLLLGQFIILLMFYVVLPEVPLYIWFTFMAVQLILTRIPFLPSQDFIFAGIAISLAGSMPVAPEAVAGIVIARGILNKVGGIAIFGMTQFLEAKGLIRQPETKTSITDRLTNNTNNNSTNGQKKENQKADSILSR